MKCDNQIKSVALSKVPKDKLCLVFFQIQFIERDVRTDFCLFKYINVLLDEIKPSDRVYTEKNASFILWLIHLWPQSSGLPQLAQISTVIGKTMNKLFVQSLDEKIIQLTFLQSINNFFTVISGVCVQLGNYGLRQWLTSWKSYYLVI